MYIKVTGNYYYPHTFHGPPKQSFWKIFLFALLTTGTFIFSPSTFKTLTNTMATSTPVIINYIRTSTSDQLGDKQLKILQNHFPTPADYTHFDLAVDGTLPPFARPNFSGLVNRIRKQHPKAQITVRIWHIDRWLKTQSAPDCVATWEWMLRNHITLAPVDPVPRLTTKQLGSNSLPSLIYDLVWDRIVALGHGNPTTASKPFKISYLPLQHILGRSVSSLRALPKSRHHRDPEFRRFARAWCVFGAFNPLLALITSSQRRGGRDPGGWGREPEHLGVFRTLSRLMHRFPTLNPASLARKLNRNCAIRPLVGKSFDRDSIRCILASPGYGAYVLPIHIPTDLRPRYRNTLPDGRYRVQQLADSALAANQPVLLVSGTGSGKMRVALDHHRSLLAADPDHLTVVVEPHKSVIWEMVENYSGVSLCGNLDSKANRKVLAQLQAGTEGGLIFLTPDKLMTVRNSRLVVSEAIQKRKSVFLVVDEGDCVLEDAEYRKAYRDFKDSVNAIQPSQVLLMTATAAKGFVRKYLHSQVLPNNVPWTLIRGSLDRPNLFYQGHLLRNPTARRVYSARIVEDHISQGHRGIVFADTIRQATRMQAFLESHLGYKVGICHSQRTDAQNLAVLEGYRSGQIHVVVATSGFGRGLDLAVDFVVVAHTPDNLSTLIQFIGRAGRDGRPAYCWWLTCGGDHYFLEHVRSGLKTSALDDPARLYLLEQTHRIEDLSQVADRVCLRLEFLKSQGPSKAAHLNPRRCCLVCAQEAEKGISA